jgi:hypothetical protein
MARVIALSADLMFGSRLQSALSSAGHEVELIGDAGRLRTRLSGRKEPGTLVLVVDLTDPDLDGAGALESLGGLPALAGARTLGFYSHVDAGARERGKRAGFDMLVPRSRMRREGASLVERLSGHPAT